MQKQTRVCQQGLTSMLYEITGSNRNYLEFDSPGRGDSHFKSIIPSSSVRRLTDLDILRGRGCFVDFVTIFGNLFSL